MSDNFQTSCSSHFGSRLLPFFWFFLLVGFSACSWIKDDRSNCSSGFIIRLQPVLNERVQPGSGAGIITKEIDKLSLYVFDAKGQFVCLHTENRQSLADNDYNITLPLEYRDNGIYELVLWAGEDNPDYQVPNLTPGRSTRDDLTLWMKRDADGCQNDKQGHLWYGHIKKGQIQPSEMTLITIPIIKDSNRFSITLHDASEKGLKADDYDFTLRVDNGLMDVENNIIKDNWVTYGAYHKESSLELESTTTREGEVYLANARLNSLRLLAENEARLVITNRHSGQKVVNVNLTQYLLMTRSLFEDSKGVKFTDQEYLDYQDQFNVIFYLCPMGILVSLNINGWIIRLNDAEL